MRFRGEEFAQSTWALVVLGRTPLLIFGQSGERTGSSCQGTDRLRSHSRMKHFAQTAADELLLHGGRL
jgi:hypothetical protein